MLNREVSRLQLLQFLFHSIPPLLRALRWRFLTKILYLLLEEETSLTPESAVAALSKNFAVI